MFTRRIRFDVAMHHFTFLLLIQLVLSDIRWLVVQTELVHSYNENDGFYLMH